MSEGKIPNKRWIGPLPLWGIDMIEIIPNFIASQDGKVFFFIIIIIIVFLTQ